MGHGRNKTTRVIFAKYMMRIPNQMLYMPVKHGASRGEILPTFVKSVGSTRSVRSTRNAEQYKHDTQNTNVIDLSVGEDDLLSTVRTHKAKKQKVCKSPTIADMLATQRAKNSGTIVKVGQRGST